jgi:hypothetical protein
MSHSLAKRLHSFLAHVERDGECWMWKGNVKHGYGKYGGRVAHRVIYELLIGAIPLGRELDHLCRRPLCVNPLHLEPVTRVENIARRMSAHRGGRTDRCVNGHPYNAENTRMRGGTRICRVCQRAATARHRARQTEMGVSDV